MGEKDIFSIYVYAGGAYEGWPGKITRTSPRAASFLVRAEAAKWKDDMERRLLWSAACIGAQACATIKPIAER